jgi:5-methyltetrahydropteroyltriglutamate--homocysteine methyltransferase
MSSSDSAVVGRVRAIPRAEHVGSLLRPARLVQARQGDDAGHAATVEDEVVREVVQRQVDLGLDCVTDGEIRRRYFQSSFDDAVSGYVESDDPPVFFTNDQGEKIQLPTPRIVGERLERVRDLAADEVAFLASATDQRIKVTFPTPSAKLGPHVFRAGVTDSAYADPDALADHVVELMRGLIDDSVAAGASYVQLDFPPYTFAASDGWAAQVRSRGHDPEVLLERWFRADEKVVEGLNHRVRRAMHLCRGNFRGARAGTGSIESLAERVFALPYDSFLVEWDDVARTGDYSPLRHVEPGGPVVVLGLISSKIPELESEDEIVRRVEEAARFIDVEQLAVSPQCGFASEQAGNPGIDEDVQWRKLDLVARVADRVWGR